MGGSRVIIHYESCRIFTVSQCKLFSHEASRDTGEAWAHPTAGQKLVRPAGLRHHGGRLVRGLDVAHQQPQVVIGAAGKFGINIVCLQ